MLTASDFPSRVINSIRTMLDNINFDDLQSIVLFVRQCLGPKYVKCFVLFTQNEEKTATYLYDIYRRTYGDNIEVISDLATFDNACSSVFEKSCQFFALIVLNDHSWCEDIKYPFILSTASVYNRIEIYLDERGKDAIPLISARSR